jgi:predicted anti-sigma-YlaC factor YlaD
MTLPERLLQILTLKCEGASSLTSRELDEPLSVPELLAVRGHLLVCRSCRRFRRQLLFLRLAVQRQNARLEQAGAEQDALSPEARVRIERVLTEADAGRERPGESD